MAQNFLSDIKLGDSIYIRLGDRSGGDLNLYHNGTNTFIDNHTGQLYIRNFSDDKNIHLQSDDGSGGMTDYIVVHGSENIVKFQEHTRHLDNKQARFGTGSDLIIHHNTVNSFIQNSNGNLYIDNDADDADIYLRSDDGNGGKTAYFYLDGSAVNTRFVKDIKFSDDVKALFGGSADLKIYHDGSNSYVRDTNEGNLYLDTNGDFIGLISDGSFANGKMGLFYKDGAVKLYYDNSLKIETTSAGVEITGNLDTPNISINDYVKHNGNADAFFGFPTTNTFSVGTGGTERMRVDNAGKVGIGKTPSTWAFDLDTGLIYIAAFDGANNTGVVINSNNTTAAQIMGYSNSASTYNDLDIRANSTAGSGVYIDGSLSYVGVGTTAPQNVLHVHQTDVNSHSYIHLTHADGGAAGTDGLSIGVLADGTNASVRLRENGYLNFWTNNLERMRITSAGTLLVGTTSAQSGTKFEVNGVSYFQGVNTTNGTAVFVADSNKGTAQSHIHYGSTGDWYIRPSSNSGKVVISDNANMLVGIGTASPAQKLHVVGTQIRLDNNSGAGGGYYLHDGSGTFRAALWDNGTDTRLFADGNGSTAAITIESNNATFANNIYLTSSSKVIKADLSSGGTTRTAEIEFYNSSNGAIKYMTTNSSTGGHEFWTQGSKRFEVEKGGDATFTGDITVSGGDITASNFIAGVSGGSVRIKNSANNTIATFASGLDTTFAGQVTVDSNWVSDEGSLSIVHDQNTLGGIGIVANSVYKGGLIQRDGTAGDYMELTTYTSQPLKLRTSNTDTLTVATNGEVTIKRAVDGDFTGLRIMNQKSYGSGTGNNERPRLVLGIAESGTADTAREGFVIESLTPNETDSSHINTIFKTRASGSVTNHVLFEGSSKQTTLYGHLRLNSGKALRLYNAAGSGWAEMAFNESLNMLQIQRGLVASSDSALNLGTNTVRWANVYADTYYGDGSNLTGVTSEWDGSRTGNASITGKLSVGGTHTATHHVHIKNTSGDNRGIMIEQAATNSYAELAFKSDLREFRLGTGGDGTNNVNAENLFYIYDATTGGTAGHRFEIDSAGDVKIRNGALKISGDNANYATLTESSAGILTIATVDDFRVDAGGDITLDAAGNDVRFKDSTITYGYATNESDNFVLGAGVQDKDIIFRGNDGGSSIDALTLDMSDSGTAKFNGGVIIAGDEDRITAEGGSMYLGGGNGNTTLVQFSGHSIPDQDSSKDLGTTNRYWRHAYIDAMTTTGNVTIGGDLQVNGETTTTNVVNLDVSDNIIGLNRGSTSNANDSGLIIERGSTGDNAAFLWDESADRFVFGTTTANPAATGNITYTAAAFGGKGLWTTTSAVTHWGVGPNSTAYGTLTWDTGYAAVHANGSNVLRLGSGSDTDAVIIDGSNMSIAGDLTVSGGDITLGTDVYAKKIYRSTATISSSSYTTVATVNGDNLSSAVRMVVTGTSGNVVMANIAEIIVNHSTDILIKTTNSFYRKLFIKVVSNNNEDFAIELKRDGDTNNTTIQIEIEPLGNETITFTNSHSYSSSTLEHESLYGETTSSNDTAGNKYHKNMQDNQRIKLGNSADLQLYHDGSNSYIDNNTGWLNIPLSQNGMSIANADFSASIAKFLLGGAVELYHNGSKKFETTSTGINVTGHADMDTGNVSGKFAVMSNAVHASYDFYNNGTSYFNNDVTFSGDNYHLMWDRSANALEFWDNAKLTFGDPGGSPNLELYHDGTHSYIDNDHTGDLYVRSLNDDVVIQAADDVFIYTQAGEDAIIARGDGAVELYYNNSKKLETANTGIKVSGDVMPSTDGGAKLGAGSPTNLRWAGIELSNGAGIQWTNGDARIIEGLVNNYSLSFQTYNSSTTTLSTALRLDGNNTATFPGKIHVGSGTPNGFIDVHADNGNWRVNSYGAMYFRNSSNATHESYIHSRSDGSLSIGRVAESDWTGSGAGAYAATTYDHVKFETNSNATFAGDITVNGGDFNLTKQNGSPYINMLYDGTNPGTNTLLHYFNFRVDYNGTHEDWGGIEHRTNASAVRTDLRFNVKSTSGNVQTGLAIRGGSAAPLVGVGTSDPDAKLEIIGNGRTNSTTSLRVRSDDDQQLFYVRDDGVVSVTHNYFYVDNPSGMYSNGKIHARGGVTDDGGTLGLGGSNAVDNLVLTSNTSALFKGDVHLDTLGSMISFYGNSSGDHAIMSKGLNGQADDDIRINSYGGVFINLDSNGNNDDSADFKIVRHSSTGAVSASDTLLSLKHENAQLTVGRSATGQVVHGSKSVGVGENTFTTVLTVSLANHTSCYVKIFGTGDWSSHSAVTYLGEFFLQNGANGYNEPGMIIREVDNTKTDAIVAKIVDPTGTSNPKNFEIQLKADDTVAAVGPTIKITYEVMGVFSAVS